MSDQPNNHNYLKLIVMLLTTVLTSGGVTRWLNGNLPEVATQNSVRSQAGEASLMIYGEKLWELQKRVDALEKSHQ